MLRALLAACAVALLAAGPATAGPTRPDRCPHRHGERTLARSAQAVLSEASVPEGHSADATIHTLYACSRLTGRRRVVERHDVYSLAPGPDFERVRLAGTRVAYIVATWSKDGVSGTADLVTADALRGGRRRSLEHLTAYPDPRPFATVRLTSDGTVAWLGRTGRGDDVHVWSPDRGRRRLDHGFRLTRLTLRDGVVRWRHGPGDDRSAPAVLPPDPCPTDGPRHDGDEQVVVVASGRTTTSCVRATGATRTFAAGLADFDGTHLALVTDEAVTRADALTGTTETFRTSPMPNLATIDAAGSIAWTSGYDLWLSDGHGTRIARTFDTLPLFARDGRTLAVQPGPLTLVLDP
jgi:hypothetical protein